MELDVRKLRILAAIVSQYIKSGEPVGSKAICTMEGIGVSSATVRNEMSALFEMGLLEQPHTSAGRVPSHLGYRIYVSRLMRCDALSLRERDEVDALFNVGDPDPDRLIDDATQRLAHYTHCATVSITALAPGVHVKRVELIPADERTVVILLLASNGAIKMKACRAGFRVTRDICDFFTKFVSDRLRDRSLYEISLQYLNSVAVSLGEYSRLFTPLLAAVFELCKEVYDGHYVVRGQSNLLDYRELAGQARELFALLEDRDRMRTLLCGRQGEPPHPGARVTIGRENHAPELVDASLIVARFEITEGSAGAIGMVGPVRLDYGRLMPHVEYFAGRLGKLLTETYNTDRGTF